MMCPNGCGRQMVRTARECRPCATARKRREQGGTSRQREAAALHDQGLSYAQIGKQMTISPARALQLVRRALVADDALGQGDLP